MENKTAGQLQSFVKENHEWPPHQPNVIGWEVKNEAGAFVGEVVDLIYDKIANSVRYLVLNLEDNSADLGSRKVMIPIGIASLHDSDDEIILPNLHNEQLALLPDYRDGEVLSDTEEEIRRIIGSPAALRMEETIAEVEQANFYQHHHFDTGKFYRQTIETPAVPNSTDRAEEKQLIHELVDGAVKNSSDQEPSSGDERRAQQDRYDNLNASKD